MHILVRGLEALEHVFNEIKSVSLKKLTKRVGHLKLNMCFGLTRNIAFVRNLFFIFTKFKAVL